MRFATTPAFDADVRRLKREHLDAFRECLRDRFIPACDSWLVDSARPWPATLRVKPVRGARGVLEMTWSFASPDGRATFEIVSDADGPLLLWRRIGDHGVFRNP